MSFFERTDNFVARLSAGVAITGGLGLFFAIIVTCTSIILKVTRRVLDATLGSVYDSDTWSFIRPILGEEELVQYGVGFALFAALPWIMYKKGHVKIDLFEALFSTSFNRVLNLVGDVAFAIIAYLILSRQWFEVFRKARRSENSLLETALADPALALDRLKDANESQILGIKTWPLYVVAETCVLLFLIVALFCVFRSARELFTGIPTKETSQ